MKLFINARFLTQPISGVQRYAIECSRQIKELFPECVFVAPKDIIHHDIAQELGAITIGSRTGHKWEQWDLPLYLWKHKRPKLLNLANTAPMLYGNNYVVIHDLAFFHHPEWNSKGFATWYNILIPRIAMGSRHVFTVSETIKAELVQHYKLPPNKISVTYNGIGESFKTDETIFEKPKEKIILSVGTFNIRKNQDALVKGFLESDIRDEYKLVLIGDKNKIFAEVGLNEQHLKSNIEIHSNVSSEDLTAFYEKAAVVASVSLYEGFGIPVLEGLNYGCKVLCSDIPVYRELFSNVATFCNPKDVRDIAARLNEIAHVPRVFDKVVVDGLLEKYSYRGAAAMLLKVVVEVHAKSAKI